MLHIFEELFSLEFLAIAGDELDNSMVWHDDVQMFSVWSNEDQRSDPEFLGYLYLDLFFREGKYQNPSSHGFQPVSLPFAVNVHYSSHVGFHKSRWNSTIPFNGIPVQLR